MKSFLKTVCLILIPCMLIGKSMIAENRELSCEVRIAKPKENSQCYVWKTSGGMPTNVAGRSEPHLMKLITPDGKSFSLRVQNVIIFSDDQGTVKSVDFHLAAEDQTYTDAYGQLVQTFKDLGLLEKINKDTLNKMKTDSTETLYPKAVIYSNITLSGTLKKNVVTEVTAKEQGPDAKIWRAQFQIYLKRN